MSVENLTKELNERLDKVKALEADLEKQKANFIAHQGISSSDSLETKALKLFGCGHVKQLLEVNTCHPRFNMVPNEIKSFVLGIKSDFDIARWTAQMFHGEQKDFEDPSGDRVIPGNVKSLLETKHAKSCDLQGRLKAFSTTTSGYGADWVPTAMSNQYIDEYELQKVIASKFKEIQMPTNPFDMPVKTGRAKAKKVAEGAAAGASTDWGTTKLTFSAVKSVEYYELPEEINEDTAVNFMEIGRSEVVEAQIRALEAAIIRGCTGTHMDSDFAAAGADVAEKFWNGLCKRALANSTYSAVDFGSGITSAKLKDMRKKMGKFGVNLSELMWITSINGWNQMIGLDEVMTVDKFGPMATIITGGSSQAAVFGIPIIISEDMRDDLNAAGVYDGITTDNTSILLVNKTRFYIGRRRPIRVRVGQDANFAYDRWLLASYMRSAFNGMTQSATEVSAAVGINITV